MSHTAAFEAKPVWYLLLKAQQAKLRFNNIGTIFSLSRDFKKKKKKKKEKFMFQWWRVFLTTFPLVRWTDVWLVIKPDKLAAENPSTTFTEKVNNLH